MSVGDKSFKIYETANGSAYIKAVSSKSGKPYPVWIGQATDYTHEGHPVRTFASGSYAYFVLGKSGYPYARWLEMEE